MSTKREYYDARCVQLPIVYVPSSCLGRIVTDNNLKNKRLKTIENSSLGGV